MTEKRVQRRLAAVLSADVVGYSRLMGLDEVATLRGPTTHRRELIDPTISGYGGRVVKTTGDGVLVEFSSIVDAVQCAVDIQREMIARNASLAPDRQIVFRIGINVGDVIIDSDDIFGDGVNVAARIEALAQPGGICISADAFNQVRDRLDLTFQDLGDKELKNIARSVRVYSVRVPGLPEPETSLSPIGNLPLPDRPSIAVLPFQNMSGDPEQEYFADGIVEDIISGLSRFKWLFVIARNSTFAYKGRHVDIKQTGLELGVRYVLEGSVRKATGRVRITVQLIDATTGAHIWAERYDRSIDDIFAVQDEITISTVAAIEPNLRQAEIERVKRKRPENLDAYDLVLRAMPFSDTGMPEGALRALPFLERALQLEPEYALAHGHTALCHEFLYVRAGRHEENRLAAIHHGHTAIALGPDDATALTFGGIAIGLVEHDRTAANEAFERALALCPSASWAYIWGSLIAGWGGEAEHAIDWGTRGIRLSPFDPWITAALHGIFLGNFVRGRFEDAAAAARRAIASKPGFSISHMMLAAALVMLGRVAEAKASAEQVIALQANFTSSGQCDAIGAVPMVSEPLIDALRQAGLPE